MVDGSGSVVGGEPEQRHGADGSGQGETGADGEDDRRPKPTAGRPPRSVAAAVVVLGVLALTEAGWTLVLLLPPSPISSTLQAASLLVSGLLRIIMWAVLARFLWRGSATARVLALLLAGANLLSTAYGIIMLGDEPGSELDLISSGVDTILLVTLLALLLAPATKAWNTRRRLD